MEKKTSCGSFQTIEDHRGGTGLQDFQNLKGSQGWDGGGRKKVREWPNSLTSQKRVRPKKGTWEKLGGKSRAISARKPEFRRALGGRKTGGSENKKSGGGVVLGRKI